MKDFSLFAFAKHKPSIADLSAVCWALYGGIPKRYKKEKMEPVLTPSLKWLAIWCLTLAWTCAVSSPAHAQNEWDRYDVVDGENPTLRHGFYVSENGQIELGRYYFLDDGENLQIRLAPYGQPQTELIVSRFDRKEGTLELVWGNNAERTCQLTRYTNALFLGTCTQEERVSPMAIRIANRSDYEMMGLYFEPSQTDVAILQRAKAILIEQAERNLNGDRDCSDDRAEERFSVYCAMYVASLETAGLYRHRRPAMQELRRSLTDSFPGQYVHQLRDISNDPNVTNERIAKAIDVAIDRLMAMVTRSE